MSLFENIKNRMSAYFINRADETTLRVAAEVKNTGRAVSGRLVQAPEAMMAKQLRDWISAVMMATDRMDPQFSGLADIYNNMFLDNHLGSVIDSRILFCQRSPFKIINDNGDENEELTELFERPWMEELIRLVMLSKFQGRTLIEIFETNELGELETVDEIPQSHFNVRKHIITREVGDQTGWEYRRGALQNYYIQVGKDYDLGMLNLMVPAILAKKLGMGAWLDFVDKYGVPPLFITTDRMDTNRLKELYEAGTNFKRNNFMVGQGNEKFEVGTTGNVNSGDTFDLLVERINSEVSKRILGGSGLSDEKAYVGSSEIQFKLAKDRFESDKLFVKNVMNRLVFPRLVKLSPVYAALATHSFDWDAQEAMSKMEIADLVVKLGSRFDVDPEWVEQQTGVPILGMRSFREVEEDPDKKKRLTRQKLIDGLAAFYPESGPEIDALDFTRWNTIIRRIAQDLHSGKLKPEDLDREAIDRIFDDFNEAGQKGYGEAWTALPGDGDTDLANEMKRNLYMFSGAKLYSELIQINRHLYDRKGKIRPFNQFEVLAKKVDRQYNRHRLRTEYNTARTAAQMAQKWERIQENKDLFPNLKFQTVGDDRVREAHAELEGIIKPVDDPFWLKYYPPLEWNCRCDVVQTAEAPRGEVPKDMHEPLFQGNVGIDGEIFTKKHTFFRLIHDDQTALRNLETFKLFLKPESFKTPRKNKIGISIFRDNKDFKDNLSRGIMMADKLSMDVEIRPDVKEWRNPEYRLNGLIADLYKGDIIIGLNDKRIQIKEFIDKFNNTYPKHKISENYAIAFDITNVTIDYNIARVINGKFKAGNKLQFVVIINNGKITKLNRSDSYETLIEKIESINAKEEQ